MRGRLLNSGRIVHRSGRGRPRGEPQAPHAGVERGPADPTEDRGRGLVSSWCASGRREEYGNLETVGVPVGSTSEGPLQRKCGKDGLAWCFPITHRWVRFASPAIRKFKDQPWTRRADCHRKHIVEHCSLLGDIARFAESVPERPAQVQEARRVSRHRDFLHQRQSDRRHAPGFDLSGEQSHGPRADRSGGYQQRQIDARAADAPRDFFDRRHEPLRRLCRKGSPCRSPVLIECALVKDEMKIIDEF